MSRFCLGALLVLLAGCATPGGSGNRYLVSSRITQFYKYGPAQAFGPDLVLNRGQKLTMVNRQFGFSQVQLEDGTPGFVPTEDLKPAPPEPKPAAVRVAARGSSVKLPTLPERGLDLSDLPAPPLPTHDEPKKPDFRAQPIR